MTTQDKSTMDKVAQRDAVKRNFEKSTETEPGEFQDESNESKVVEIGPDVTDQPIKGIDP